MNLIGAAEIDLLIAGIEVVVRQQQRVAEIDIRALQEGAVVRLSRKVAAQRDGRAVPAL